MTPFRISEQKKAQPETKTKQNLKRIQTIVIRTNKKVALTEDKVWCDSESVNRNSQQQDPKPKKEIACSNKHHL